MSHSFTYRVLAHRTRHWTAIERGRSKEAWKNFHGPPRGRQPGRYELHLCQYIHSYIQDEEWLRQTSGHGFWWFIFVVCFFSILSIVVENKDRGSPERGWSGFFVVWSITNTGTRQTRNAGIQRKLLLNGSPTALRSSLVSYCALDSSASCGFGLRPHNSYHIPIMLRLWHIMLLTLLTIFPVRSLFVLLAGSRSVPDSRNREKWHGHNTTGEAFRSLPYTHTFFFLHTHMFLHFCTHRFLHFCTTHILFNNFAHIFLHFCIHSFSCIFAHNTHTHTHTLF